MLRVLLFFGFLFGCSFAFSATQIVRSEKIVSMIAGNKDRPYSGYETKVRYVYFGNKKASFKYICYEEEGKEKPKIFAVFTMNQNKDKQNRPQRAVMFGIELHSDYCLDKESIDNDGFREGVNYAFTENFYFGG